MIRQLFSRLALLILFIFLSLVNTGTVFAQEAMSELSSRRLRAIQNLIDNLWQEGADFNLERDKEKALGEIAKRLPLIPDQEPMRKTTGELSEESRRQVDKHFPESHEEILAKAEAGASEQYKAAQRLSHVEVYFDRGDTRYRVDGIYYSHDGSSVQIGSRHVALFDMLPQCRAMFDPKFAESERRKHVEQSVKDFYLRKQELSNRIFRDLRKEQFRHNEGLGYIFAWREWRTPKEVAEVLMQTKAMLPRPVEVAAANGDNGEVANGGGDAVVEDDSAEPVDGRVEEKTAVAEIIAKAEEIRDEIGSSFSGIDGDQGYKLAVWGMTKLDVRVLLADDFGIDPLAAVGANAANSPAMERSVDTISFDRGSIRTVELHFFHDYFHRVVINFDPSLPEVLRDVWMRMHERYGTTDEDKAARAAAAEQISEAEAADGGGRGGAEAELPLEVVRTWTGDVTVGSLFAKLNNERTGYEKFTFTKDSRNLVKELQLRRKQERNLKEEEERQRKLKEFRKGIDF